MLDSLAIDCYLIKQLIASASADSAGMAESDINELLAENLQAAMDAAKVNQTTLGKKSGVRQNTISLYLKPSKRKPGAKGKPASGKVTEVAMMARALGVEAWQLLHPQGSTSGGTQLNGWPLSPELLAALQNMDAQAARRAENILRSALDMSPVPAPAQETADAVA